MVVAAALLEWAGWRIVWRHAGEPPVLDAAWREAFLAGIARTLAGACGVGAAMAAGMLGLARARSWARAQARRRTVAAFVAGSAALLSALTVLTLWAS